MVYAAGQDRSRESRRRNWSDRVPFHSGFRCQTHAHRLSRAHRRRHIGIYIYIGTRIELIPERVTATGVTGTCRSSESASLSRFLARFLVRCDVHIPGSHEKCPGIVTISKCQAHQKVGDILLYPMSLSRKDFRRGCCFSEKFQNHR